MRHALLPQEREAPDAFSARCKLQVKKAGRAEEIYALLQAEPELLTPDERLSAVLDEHFRWETVRAADRPAASGEGDETGFQALGRLLPQPLPEKPVIGSGTGRRGLLDQAGYARKRAVCRRAARAVRDAREPSCVR